MLKENKVTTTTKEHQVREVKVLLLPCHCKCFGNVVSIVVQLLFVVVKALLRQPITRMRASKKRHGSGKVSCLVCVTLRPTATCMITVVCCSWYRSISV